MGGAWAAAAESSGPRARTRLPWTLRGARGPGRGLYTLGESCLESCLPQAAFLIGEILVSVSILFPGRRLSRPPGEAGVIGEEPPLSRPGEDIPLMRGNKKRNSPRNQVRQAALPPCSRAGVLSSRQRSASAVTPLCQLKFEGRATCDFGLSEREVKRKCSLT